MGLRKDWAGSAALGVLGMVLLACSSMPRAVPAPPAIPTTVPDRVSVFVVDGNPLNQKIFPIALDGVPIMEIGWRYMGQSSATPGFQFPAGVDMTGRQTLFYEISATNLTGHPVRFIQAYSTESSLITISANSTKQAKTKLLKRADLGDQIAVYDVTSATPQLRRDYYVYGTREGKRPYSENTYVYWVEGLDQWFAVKYVRGGPDRP